LDIYKFRREDTGEIIEVDFETAFKRDVLGCITLEDGVEAKFVRDQLQAKFATAEAVKELSKPMVNDSAGFGQHQFDDFEADRSNNGFSAIEFRRDPQVPEFFQVHCSCPKQFRRYMRHRGQEDANSRNGGGVGISADAMKAAEDRMRETYGPPDTIS